MTNFDALRLVKAHIDVVVLLMAAWAVAAWMVFRVSEYYADDLDDLGLVDVHDQRRMRDLDDESKRRES